MKKEWKILKHDAGLTDEISKSLKCSSTVAKILFNRKIVSPQNAMHFLYPSFRNLRPPFSIKDMDIAVKRIYASIINNEKILIFGDYDVDGITATTILLEFLLYAGADVSFYIPHRITEGYDLQISHITDYAAKNNINLIITADCGSNSHDAVKKANSVGIDVIVTDHHEISDSLPEAVAVVNPKRDDCMSGLDNLAGVGVAFYLLMGLRKYMRDLKFWNDKPEPNLKKICDLVSLGTIADVVPLVDENRIFVKSGLGVMKSGGSRPGINALSQVCGINTKFIGSDDIAFKLSPRLNASGRIDHANISAELLSTKSFSNAKQIAESLNEMNFKRKEIEESVIKDISIYLTKNPDELKKKSLIFSNHNWHEGVLGIAASRLAEKYCRPVVLISIKNGMGKGSARSIPGFDLCKGFSGCSDELEGFGGHSMAAGLKIKSENIALFQNHFENIVHQTGRAEDFLPKLLIDCELAFNDISRKLIDEIEFLQPFGSSNPEPIFLARDVRVLSSSIVGEKHRRMILSQPFSKKSKTFNAIFFNIDPDRPMAKSFDKLAFRLRWNYWNGEKTAQIVIEETRPFISDS